MENDPDARYCEVKPKAKISKRFEYFGSSESSLKKEVFVRESLQVLVVPPKRP